MALDDSPLPHHPPLGCLLIASPQGHSGKTTVSLALCDLLKRRGLSIQPFKKGPDYIDPSWLTVAAGRRCRNLDLFLIPRDRLILSFWAACQEADLALIEGAMGLYDGLDSHGTTAEIARLLKIPVLLVVNTTRMTTSIAAMVRGYQHFEKDIQIAGVILNYVSGSRHEKKLRDAVEKYCGIPVVGSLPKDQDLRIMERHLGLIPSPESNDPEVWVERIGRKLKSQLDLDRILTIAQTANPPHPTPLPKGAREEDGGPLPNVEREDSRRLFTEGQEGTDGSPGLSGSRGERNASEEIRESPLPRGERVGVRGSIGVRPRIGLLYDRAFNFYYPDNLDALVNEGAELIIINSLRDRLPRLDGLYIGGGFPEFFLKELEENCGLRKDIAEAVQAGLPVYAECAGLMYLCRSISWQDRSYEMVGVIPSEVKLSEKPEGHGYVVAEVVRGNPFLPVGLAVRGHEFHHSSIFRVEKLEFAYQIKRGKGITGKEDGIIYKNLFASYIHLHALGTPQWAEGFVSLASKEERSRQEVLNVNG